MVQQLTMLSDGSFVFLLHSVLSWTPLRHLLTPKIISSSLLWIFYVLPCITYMRSLHLYTFKFVVNCIKLHKIRSLIISSAIIVTKSDQKTRGTPSTKAWRRKGVVRSLQEIKKKLARRMADRKYWRGKTLLGHWQIVRCCADYDAPLNQAG